MGGLDGRREVAYGGNGRGESMGGLDGRREVAYGGNGEEGGGNQWVGLMGGGASLWREWEGGINGWA